MKSIANRTGFALILACVLLFGVLTFSIRYFLYADRWVSFTGSPHVYTDGKLNTGEIVDRSGEVLYTSAAGQSYSDSASLRKATLHLIGDPAGNIPPRILRAFASKLFGYDKLNGTAAMENSGGELKLTVSAQVQAVAMQAMNGRKGAVGVYNYRTGEILCAVSSPSFDPLDPPDLETDNEDGYYDGVYIYRFFHASYTPGSIFKLTTLAAALDAVPGLTEETFTCTGERIINGEKVTCPRAHGELTLQEALAKSCNCSFAEISLRTGKRVLTGQAEAERLTENLSIDGITTVKGNFDLSEASDNDMAWAGIGQYTDLVNPCQYMVFMGAIAGGGTAAEPCLVSSAQCGGRTTYEAITSQTPRMLSSSAAETLRTYMRYNVTEIYDAVNIPGVEVCAKSGTAEVGTDANTATFAGFIAEEDYPLAFIVVVEGGGAGSSVAAPVARSVLEACMNVLNGER